MYKLNLDHQEVFSQDWRNSVIDKGLAILDDCN